MNEVQQAREKIKQARKKIQEENDSLTQKHKFKYNTVDEIEAEKGYECFRRYRTDI